MNEIKIKIPDNCELIKDGDTYIVKEKKQGPTSDIDWEQRRYEIAKDILAATYDFPMDGKSYAKVAVGVADALIAELKKGGSHEI